jgi:peptide methionine sulfoxide reductase msrA/msrB
MEVAMNFDAFPSATFAGGCFWCLEADALHVPGVLEAVSGYTGGHEPEPTYEAVCEGGTGHLEAVRLRYDPALVSFRALADWFWRRIDPTNADGQFCDHGEQYQTAIFFNDSAQEQDALASRQALADSGLPPRPIATRILPAARFHPAEPYHQAYSRTNPRRYQLYRQGCGRDATLARIWGANDPLAGFSPLLPRQTPDAATLRAALSPLAYHVTREDGTEPPFDNAYWDEHRPGLYVDAVSGAPLFHSAHKFDSGTGWPSFTRPLSPGNVVLRRDDRLLAPRVEVRAWHSDSHLGHVFDDGPRDSGGQRWCMNSAALRFIPAQELEAAGYGRYAPLF